MTDECPCLRQSAVAATEMHQANSMQDGGGRGDEMVLWFARNILTPAWLHPMNPFACCRRFLVLT